MNKSMKQTQTAELVMQGRIIGYFSNFFHPAAS